MDIAICVSISTTLSTRHTLEVSLNYAMSQVLCIGSIGKSAKQKVMLMRFFGKGCDVIFNMQKGGGIYMNKFNGGGAEGRIGGGAEGFLGGGAEGRVGGGAEG